MPWPIVKFSKFFNLDKALQASLTKSAIYGYNHKSKYTVPIEIKLYGSVINI